MCVLVIQWPFSTSFSSPITSRRKGGTRHLTKNSVRINRRILPFSSNCNSLPEHRRIIHTANNPRVVSHFLEMKLNTLYIFERSSFSHRYSTFSFFFFFLFSVIKFDLIQRRAMFDSITKYIKVGVRKSLYFDCLLITWCFTFLNVLTNTY